MSNSPLSLPASHFAALERAVGEGFSGRRLVCYLDTFAVRGKQDRVFANHIARADGLKARCCRAFFLRFRPGYTRRICLNRTPAPRPPLRHAQGVPEGASFLWRWCASMISMSVSAPIALAVISQQLEAEVDADAHVRRINDGDLVRGGLQQFMVFPAEAGRADDHFCIGGHALLNIGRKPGGQTEINQHIDIISGIIPQRRDIRDRHAEPVCPGQFNRRPAPPRVICRVQSRR